MAGNAKGAGYTCVVELEFCIKLFLLWVERDPWITYLLRVERDLQIIFIGNFWG